MLTGHGWKPPGYHQVVTTFTTSSMAGVSYWVGIRELPVRVEDDLGAVAARRIGEEPER